MGDGDLDQILLQIQELLPPTWTLARQPSNPAQGQFDAIWTIVAPDGSSEQILVDRKSSWGPTAIRQRFHDSADAEAAADRWNGTPLLAAPWIGPAAAAVLKARGLSYADATGNVSLVLRRLPVVLQQVGAQHNPRPRQQGHVGLSGPVGLRLVRFLVDVAPPYTLTELADGAALSLAHVSRLIRTLADQDLVRRDATGVKDVNWAELLRERARQAPPLIRAGTYLSAVARRGIDATLDDLRELNPSSAPLLTGSFAAQAVAPAAEAAQLLLWTSDPVRTRKDLALLPSKTGGNVLLLVEPEDSAVRIRPRQVGGVWHVAVSQLALDCLSGNGRLPAEGEEILRWMSAHEAQWRNAGARLSVDAGAPRSSPTQPGDWTDLAVERALARLERSAGTAQATAVREAANNGGYLSREAVYDLAGYPASRSLRGFTRPTNRITQDLKDLGLLAAHAPPLLETVYNDSISSYQTAQGFRIPDSVVALLHSNRRHVLPGSNGGWDVTKSGASRRSGHADTQAGAIDRAREIVTNAGGGEVVIHGRDGRIRDSDTVVSGDQLLRIDGK